MEQTSFQTTHCYSIHIVAFGVELAALIGHPLCCKQQLLVGLVGLGSWEPQLRLYVLLAAGLWLGGQAQAGSL
jgi:hypothetical protein